MALTFPALAIVLTTPRYTHGKSDRMRNQSERRDHLRQLRSSVDKDAYTFNCGAMRKLLAENPCHACPVLQAKHEEVHETTGIQVQTNGYFFPGPNGSSRQLTNFLLEPIACYLVDGQWGRIIESHDFYAVRDGQQLGRLSVHRSQWDSVDAFKAAMNVVPGGLVKVNADQIMDLKRFLTEVDDMDSIVSVNEAGVHRHVEYAGGDLARDGEIVVDTSVWVEPRWSINAVRIRGSHVLHHKSVQNVVELRNIADATPDDLECLEVFRKAITINRPEVIGTILGWVVACNLKHHLIGMGNEFPLLHLFGPSEVGKTKTAQILTALAGADYHVAPMVANSATPFPLKEMASMTTTMPRIFDECTASTFSRTGHWLAVRDILKAAYQGSAMPTGTVRTGGNKLDKTSAMSIQYRATAPLIYTATQATDDPELVTRSIIMQLDQKQKREGTRQQDFEWLLMHGWRPLFRLTRLLVMDALQLSREDVRLQLADSLQLTPLKMDGRLRKNLAVILLGFRNLKTTLVTRGFPTDLIEVVDAIENKTLMFCEEHSAAAMRKVRLTEVDQLYQTLSEMAAATSDRGNHYLVAGTHYLLKDGVLYLEPFVWTPYKQFLRTVSETPKLDTFAKFLELAKKETYFIISSATKHCRVSQAQGSG